MWLNGTCLSQTFRSGLRDVMCSGGTPATVTCAGFYNMCTAALFNQNEANGKFRLPSFLKITNLPVGGLLLCSPHVWKWPSTGEARLPHTQRSLKGLCWLVLLVAGQQQIVIKGCFMCTCSDFFFFLKLVFKNVLTFFFF